MSRRLSDLPLRHRLADVPVLAASPTSLSSTGCEPSAPTEVARAAYGLGELVAPDALAQRHARGAARRPRAHGGPAGRRPPRRPGGADHGGPRPARAARRRWRRRPALPPWWRGRWPTGAGPGRPGARPCPRRCSPAAELAPLLPPLVRGAAGPAAAAAPRPRDVRPPRPASWGSPATPRRRPTHRCTAAGPRARAPPAGRHPTARHRRHHRARQRPGAGRAGAGAAGDAGPARDGRRAPDVAALGRRRRRRGAPLRHQRGGRPRRRAWRCPTARASEVT